MEGYSSYIVDFDRKYNADKDLIDPPVSSINVHVVAKDILEAMQKAWDAVQVTPEDYEIYNITKVAAMGCVAR